MQRQSSALLGIYNLYQKYTNKPKDEFEIFSINGNCNNIYQKLKLGQAL